MKKITVVLLCVLLAFLYGCAEGYEKSEATKDFHEDMLERLVDKEILLFDDYLTDTWINDAFVESWIKVTEINGDPDTLEVECYLHLVVHNGFVKNDRYFYWHIFYSDDGEMTEQETIKEVPVLVVPINNIFNFKYTNKIDKEWTKGEGK